MSRLGALLDWLGLRVAARPLPPATPSDTRRPCGPGFTPWERGGGAGYRPGDRVRVARLSGGRSPRLDGVGTVVDAYDRASDAWSPLCPAVRVRLDVPPTPNHPHDAIEYFVGYDAVERLT